MVHLNPSRPFHFLWPGRLSDELIYTDTREVVSQTNVLEQEPRLVNEWACLATEISLFVIHQWGSII